MANNTDQKRILLHGSDHIVEVPKFGVGKPYNDYGLGFYCTEHADMAKEWSVGFDHSGFANKYELDATGLQVINLSSPEYTTLHWLAVLLQNRWFDVRAPLANEAREYLIAYFNVDISNADIVEGYRADDSYFMFAQDFIVGTISYRQLQNAMHLGNLGHQVMLKSRRAFKQIKFIDAEPVPQEIWLPRREQRDRGARETYFNRERNARKTGDIFITDIMDEKMGAKDERLR